MDNQKNQDYTLIGTEVSLYSGKLRSYLRNKRISFQEQLATGEVFKEIIIPRTGVRYIPVLLTPDAEGTASMALQDTTEIIDYLEDIFDSTSVYPATPRQKLAALLLEVYADEWLVIPAMHYRWYYRDENLEFISREFGKTAAPDQPLDVQLEVGKSTVDYFSGATALLGATDTMKTAVEAWYESLLKLLNRHFIRHKYLLGNRPTIADFGFIGPFYAHLSRDPYPGNMMKEKAPYVLAWVNRMMRPPANAFEGELLDNDDIPEAIINILQMMFREHFPVMMDTSSRLFQWQQDHPGESIPRAIGEHEFRIGQQTGNRKVFPYVQWMMQRPVDYYQNLAGEDRTRADELLSKCNGLEGMSFPLPCRVRRENNRLVFCDDEFPAGKR